MLPSTHESKGCSWVCQFVPKLDVYIYIYYMILYCIIYIYDMIWYDMCDIVLYYVM